MLNCGIYKILNLINDKCYIGQSIDLDHREYEHFWSLKSNKHHNIHLQKSFNLYGEENFIFEVIEYCDKELLNEREKYWITIYNSLLIGNGYNLNEGGCNSSSIEQYRKVLIYNKKGQYIDTKNSIKECSNFLNCHSGSVFNALSSPTKIVKNCFVRDFIDDFPLFIDVSFLQDKKIVSKIRAGQLSSVGKKLKKYDYPDRLFSTEEIEAMVIGDLDDENHQIHGIDLNLIKVEKLEGVGLIPFKGKTKLPIYKEINLIDNFWYLEPGTYNITFKQGCKIPNYAMLLIRQRSSLLRNGGIIHSSIFDSEFKTDNIGTMMILMNPIKIEYEARIAILYGHACHPVKRGYNGQWQNDKQRKDGTK